MIARGGGIDLGEALAESAGAAALSFGTERWAAVLLRPDGIGEVVRASGLAPEGRSALAAMGPALVERVRREGRPLVVDLASLPDATFAQTGAIQRSAVGSCVLVPLFGEAGVLGSIVVPTGPVPIARGVGEMEWHVWSRAVERVQLAAATTALEIALASDRRDPMQFADGVLVLDPAERVVLADGAFRALDGWGGVDPFGRLLEELDGAEALRALRPDGPRPFRWTECDFPPASGGGAAPAPARVELDARLGRHGEERVVFLRQPRRGGVREDGTGRALSLGMRIAHAADGVARALALTDASSATHESASDRSPRPHDTLFLGFHADVVSARQIVEQALERCLPDVELSMASPNLLLEEVLDRYRDELRGQGVRTLSILGPEVGSVPVDRLALLRVLRTLVQEALDSLRPGGGTLSVRSWVESGWAHLSISDDGHGWTGPVGSIHDPFPPEPDSGDAAALLPIRDAVGRLGGRVIVDSRPGLWTRVTVMLPTERRRGQSGDTSEALASARPSGTPAVAPSAAMSILVVDDNAALRSVLRRYLERRGHRVAEAGDGEEALRTLRGGERFDRLIVDLHMPNKDGVELFDALHALDPALQGCTIFITGDFLGDTAERLLRETGRPTVRKPFDLTQIALTIEA